MRKIFAVALLALGVANAAQASQFVSKWYEGQHYCKFTNASGYFNVRFSTKVVERPRTCNGDRCSTNGYEQKNYASIYLNLWTRTYTADRVIDGGNTVSFYKDFTEGRLHVRLTKPAFGNTVRGIYTDAKGKQFGLTCTRS